jgi:putative restriction endonuclease
LLSPHYDALFDKHFISFNQSGKIIVSTHLSDEIRLLNIDLSASISINKKMEPYLQRHRARLK